MLKEISSNEVSRGGYKSTMVPITLGSQRYRYNLFVCIYYHTLILLLDEKKKNYPGKSLI